MNSKEQYWKEKNERLQFQKDWADWRKKLVEKLGPGAVTMMPWMFTQKAYKEYLDFKQYQLEETAQHAGTYLEMTQPTEQDTVPVIIDNTIVTTTASE